jgi:hypothetical protein
MRNANDNLESPFLDEEILEKWVEVNSMQVAALGRPTVGVSSVSEANLSGSRRRASMYLQSREGLGQVVKTSSGDEAGPWLAEKLPSLTGRVIGLIVIFRSSIGHFRAEVARAVARWVDPRYATQIVAANEDHLKALHQQMLDEKVPDKAPVRLLGSFFYQAPAGPWRVVRVLFPLERERWMRIDEPPKK